MRAVQDALLQRKQGTDHDVDQKQRVEIADSSGSVPECKTGKCRMKASANEAIERTGRVQETKVQVRDGSLDGVQLFPATKKTPEKVG